MHIRAISALENTQPRVQDVPVRRTPVTPAAMRTALAQAYQGLTGRAAPSSLLDVLTAQASLETGRGDKMNNFNFGGIKGAAPGGATARYMTREVNPDSTERHLVDGFRAYPSLAAGATDYLKFLQTHYTSAFDAAARGDVTGFAAELKRHGYYTESGERYATALRALVHDTQPHAPTLDRVPAYYDASGPSASMADFGTSPFSLQAAMANAPGGADVFPTTAALARVMDQVASMCARVGAPLDAPPDEKTR